MASELSRETQLAQLGILEFLSNLITESPNEGYTRVQLLVLLNCVSNDPELFDPEVIVEYAELPEPQETEAPDEIA